MTSALPDDGRSEIHRIATQQAPAAIGPYSQGSTFKDLVFASGQLPLRADGSLVEGTVAEQTKQSIANLAAVLQAGGASLATVIKTTVFVKDLSTFAEMNQAYAECFGAVAPARSTVEVARLPRDVLVEIEAIAHRVEA
ncbi:2-iminobutanoate/2-iminopropanoate deaminase [Pseudorhodoferax soli]|uniref:2-iminobutanoate/2-iminopropanoate deaminase n=2 Tax=Pseudorhodoferax soli TaxID=545864 RepID=A0A368XNC2_9BURK|nr:Rid family detoxifying hydrolase [Pseudorhodoferax soli]RCW68676.1 2-iminobutanoate/2-iminopropanoate deaminase [Pseudorhodoferax soli]